ncbi:hypothetical protein ACWDRR_42655 [Kitasatospora sp. NPDC003701]
MSAAGGIARSSPIETMGTCIRCGAYTRGRWYRTVDERLELIDRHPGCPNPAPAPTR